MRLSLSLIWWVVIAGEGGDGFLLLSQADSKQQLLSGAALQFHLQRYLSHNPSANPARNEVTYRSSVLDGVLYRL